MIEDKNLGLKIAENPEESDWATILESSKTKIRQMKIAIELEELISKHAETKVIRHTE